MRFLLITLLSLCISSLSYSQTASINNSTASSNTEEINWSNFELELENTEETVFHTNHDLQLMYIDFELIGKKVSRLVVKSEENQKVLNDQDLFDLPMNTVYELDLEELQTGNYTVEVYTYNNEIIKESIQIEK